LNRVVHDFFDGLLPIFMDEFLSEVYKNKTYWMEEHFWTKESLVPHIKLYQVVVKCLVHKSFEFV